MSPVLLFLLVAYLWLWSIVIVVAPFARGIFRLHGPEPVPDGTFPRRTRYFSVEPGKNHRFFTSSVSPVLQQPGRPGLQTAAVMDGSPFLDGSPSIVLRRGPLSRTTRSPERLFLISGAFAFALAGVLAGARRFPDSVATLAVAANGFPSMARRSPQRV